MAEELLPAYAACLMRGLNDRRRQQFPGLPGSSLPDRLKNKYRTLRFLMQQVLYAYLFISRAQSSLLGMCRLIRCTQGNNDIILLLFQESV